MLFKITFLITFISTKTLYDQIWNICVRFVISFFRIWKILATPGGGTMHPERLIMEINVVQNYVSDYFHFDHKAVWSNLTNGLSNNRCQVSCSYYKLQCWYIYSGLTPPSTIYIWDRLSKYSYSCMFGNGYLSIPRCMIREVFIFTELSL